MLNKQRHLLTSIFTTLIIFSLSLGFISCAPEEGPELIFIHTNDTHSQIDGVYLDERPTGGVIERSAFLELMRQSDPQLVYLDAGDMVQGSPYFNIWDGMIEMKAMNLQGLICSTFGNHEFDNGVEGLASMLNYACFPIINCNYDVKNTVLEPFVRNSMIIERKGVRIGITGITVDPHNLIFNKNWEGITPLDPSESSNRVAEQLRKDGCDLVILLSHLGYYPSDTIGDRYIAAHSKNIDLIIGGHSHTNIENGIEMMNAEGKPVMITQTGGKASPIGLVKIKMKSQGTHADDTKAYRPEAIVCRKLRPDLYDLRAYGRMMSDFIAPYRDSLEMKMSAVLGRASHDLPRFRPQSPLGNFTSDVIREAASKCLNRPVDVGIMNVGGLRNDLYAGDIKLGDIYKIFPFENTLSVIEIKGKYLEEIIHQIEGKRLEAISGMQITLNIKHETLPNGEAHEYIEANDLKVGGQPIDPERIYTIATNDYLAEGNDGMLSMTKASKNINTGILLRSLFVDYIQELNRQGKEIDAKTDDRVIVVEN